MAQKHRSHSVFCTECEEPIKEFDEYVVVDENIYHFDCLIEMSTRDLVETLGYRVETMEE